MRESVRDAKSGRFSSALSAYQAAAKTPAKAYDFYLECIKLVNFDEQGKKYSDYRDWKARNVKKIRATEHTMMLQFQLRYLAMTIRILNMDHDQADAWIIDLTHVVNGGDLKDEDLEKD